MKLDKVDFTLAALVVLLIFVIALLFSACACQPTAYTGEEKECFDFRYCMYANRDNEDKSICLPYAQECRALRRFVRCGDEAFRWKNQSAQECWDKINSK